MALWFFLVFLRNCLRLPDDTYSVMKMTCGQAPPLRVGLHAAPPSLWLHSALHPPLAHPRAGLRGVQPILVQLDDVGVVHQRQLLKHGLDLLLGKEDGRGANQRYGAKRV